MRPNSHILVVNGIKVRQPVFVVGAPHSGAGLVARALKRTPQFHITIGRGNVRRVAHAFARQPAITADQEVGSARVLRDAFARAWQINAHACLECSAECRDAGGRLALGACVPPGSVSRFGDGTGELLYSADVLVDAFPDVQLVQVIRDGRDVVDAMLADAAVIATMRPRVADADARLPNPYLGIWTEADQGLWRSASLAGRCAMSWRGAIRTSARLRREMPDEGLLTIRYEDLAVNPARAAAALTEYLGVPVPAATLRRPDGGAGVGAWRRRLTADQVGEIDRIAGRELLRLGYLSGDHH